ncbi:MAG: hypothetical protein WCE23_11605 [Candidatus Binatus sp.]|uniref:hypothetical protein n=1 Tax=Candidatus Binatus sp. TaxID=2811406 RepID=UPI003C3C3037
MEKATFYVNSTSGLSLARLEETEWKSLMSARGGVELSDLRDEVKDPLVDIAGSVAFRSQIEKAAGITKRQVYKGGYAEAVMGDPSVLWFGGQPVSCVNTISALTNSHQAIKNENRTDNLKKKPTDVGNGSS